MPASSSARSMGGARPAAASSSRSANRELHKGFAWIGPPLLPFPAAGGGTAFQHQSTGPAIRRWRATGCAYIILPYVQGKEGLMDRRFQAIVTAAVSSAK